MLCIDYTETSRILFFTSACGAFARSWSPGGANQGAGVR